MNNFLKTQKAKFSGIIVCFISQPVTTSVPVTRSWIYYEMWNERTISLSLPPPAKTACSFKLLVIKSAASMRDWFGSCLFLYVAFCCGKWSFILQFCIFCPPQCKYVLVFTSGISRQLPQNGLMRLDTLMYV